MSLRIAMFKKQQFAEKKDELINQSLHLNNTDTKTQQFAEESDELINQSLDLNITDILEQLTNLSDTLSDRSLVI